MSPDRILIVDDERVLRQSLKIDLEEDGFEVEILGSGEEAIERLDAIQPHLVLLDLRLPGMDGTQVLEAIRHEHEDLPVIIMTAYGDTQTTVEAIKRGADNFINKPFELHELKELITRALESQKQRREFEYLKYQQRRLHRFCDLVGESPKIVSIYEKIELLAETDCTVLIRGESGTGKELVAGAIHYKSRRAKAPLMEINCASLPESLLESELFGYEKGAFTDAKHRKNGLFELADGGTIFLDEIGEMPLSIQAKLLRFLEKKQFKRLGSTEDLKVDARIIAATNRDLAKAISDSAFREDLYYRLNVVTLNLPPLRERTEDIILLANYFLNEFCRDMGKAQLTFSDEVTELLPTLPWRGNVRELRNVIERAVIFAKGTTITRDLLPQEMRNYAPMKPMDFVQSARETQSLSIEDVLAQVEQDIIDDALRQTGGNMSRAAKLLGISRFSLIRRIDRLRKDHSVT
ncbi:sigma-54-dependent transcriptional regulator [Desulfomonile tiedjei]|uniref:Response regulator with CheY-like receiver, AAA-type ATPase, and DNA-binding domains n=1 Tax=Desulfomonile tiedjei (strain ATCC 49306 / DSM 6799 / DCB-1) TaxID=706587 RepID=I4C1V3_DESTA|nr:sigma-54 dependent transcriptional regulator [Desulfomonile tiedjei]AFM23544.1 response regulator with CheY-like receiver, AAA-type ATPase, and DNA-binding domains [Desulfomonile tiedjei DSM 6799]